MIKKDYFVYKKNYLDVLCQPHLRLLFVLTKWVFIHQSINMNNYTDVALSAAYSASADEKKLYSIKKAVLGLIEFVTTTLDEIGVELFHEITDPSLDQLEEILNELETEASKTDDLNLRQVILFAQVLIRDIKHKNPELCANSVKILKNTQVI